jgi:hypothetical protein
MTKITLVLARGPGKPEGDLADRLVLNVSLNSQGQIDPLAYEGAFEPWLASRDRDHGQTRDLEIVRLDEGWALQSTNSQDDPIWVFEGHVYRPGELVLLHRPDGNEMLYRIVAAENR